MTVTLRARWVLPIDSPPIAGGYVSIAEGRIAAIGAVDPGMGPIEDLGDVVLLPGLVNAHTHLEFSSFSQPLGVRGMSLPEWIRLVIGDRKRGDRDAAAAIAQGQRESFASGVTTIGEIATSPASFYASAAAVPTTVLFQEAIGFSAGRVDSVFGEVERRLDEAPSPAGISPHAPYTVHPRLLERLVQLAASRGAPVAMHLAESQEELELMATGSGPFRELLEERSMWDAGAIAPGTRPLDYLRQLSMAPRALVIHGGYLAADEIEFIAQHRERVSVVYCPRTHAYFGHEPYPLEAMRAAGVRISLGTDSRASNPDLSVLEEVRHVANSYSGVSPPDVLRMASLDAAKALGLAQELGSLTAGKRADIIAVRVESADSDPCDSVVSATGNPSHVWLGGVLL